MQWRSLSNLSEVEFEEAVRTHPSRQPLLYYRLLRLYRDYHFDYSDVRKYRDKLYVAMSAKDVLEAFHNMVRRMFGDAFFFEHNKRYVSLKRLKDFAKSFWTLDFSIESIYKKRRMVTLGKAYRMEYDKKCPEKNVFWRHDGFWVNYYGPLEDEGAFKILSQWKIESYQDALVRNLLLCYRHLELPGGRKKARKLAKRSMRFMRLKLIRDVVQGRGRTIPVLVKNWFLKVILGYFITWHDYTRRKINYSQFLYLTEDNPRRRRRMVHKTYKLNNRAKHYFMNSIMAWLQRDSYDLIRMDIRPQHLIKMIEVYIDEYEYTKSDWIAYKIRYLLIDIFATMEKEYYSGEFHESHNLHILYEVYFAVFWYLEKVEGVDIGRL